MEGWRGFVNEEEPPAEASGQDETASEDVPDSKLAAAGVSADQLMGWAGSGDTRQQVRLKFDSMDEAASYARDNGIDADAKWGVGRLAEGKKPLNNGMIRMNLGNVLRGRIKRGEYVIIGDKEYNEDAKAA